MFLMQQIEMFRRDVATRPRVAVKETETAYNVSMTAPGVKTQDLAVSVGDGNVFLEAILRADETKHLKVPVDGLFGPRTIRSLQSFLKAQGMNVGPVDGYFGRRTVKAAQEFLVLRDYDAGEVDGYFGRRSSSAMQQWLRDLDLLEDGILGPVDGKFGPRTVLALQMTLNMLKVPAEHDSTFSREIELPRDADFDSSEVRVTHANGLLNVTVPKRPRVPTRKLQINAPVNAPASPAEAEKEDEQSAEDEKKEEVEEKDAAEEELVVISPEEELKAKLECEGVDAETIHHLIELHGVDGADACLLDAQRLKEWESAFEDLAEMGFADRSANLKAMLKHDGSVKAAVKALVSARSAQ